MLDSVFCFSCRMFARSCRVVVVLVVANDDDNDIFLAAKTQKCTQQPVRQHTTIYEQKHLCPTDCTHTFVGNNPTCDTIFAKDITNQH